MSCKECEKYKDLGCVSHCCDLCLDLTVPYDDTYTLQFVMGARKMKTKKTFVLGQKFCFNTSCLNECANTTIEIYNSEGILISFEDGDCTYDGFKFLTEIIYCK